MDSTERIRLEFSDGCPPMTSLGDVNDAMAGIGSRLWPLNLTGTPDAIQRLLAQPTLTEAEAERVKAHFLLLRERLLQIIEDAGRKPNVSGGGALTTLDATHGYVYPQLYVAQGDVDYSRFDRFHVNTAADGTGVDEVLQMLSGRGVVIRHRLSAGDALTLHLDCPAAGADWLLTYDGGSPHIGSLSGAETGSKLVVQVIGPARWEMRYVEEV